MKLRIPALFQMQQGRWENRNDEAYLWDCKLKGRDGREVLASRKDLCVMSSYFDQLLRDTPRERNAPVYIIQEFDADIVEKALGWAYTGEIQVDGDEKGIRTLCTLLYAFGSLYGIFPVMSACFTHKELPNTIYSGEGKLWKRAVQSHVHGGA